MKKGLYTVLTFLVASALSQAAHAQAAFAVKEYIDVNNVRAAALVHGDLWWDPVAQIAQCEYPKNSGKHIMSASSIWMAGYDNNNILHQSAQTYRQNGNDYWPGPLDGTGYVDYITSAKWAKIWKVDLSDINTFKSSANHTVQNTPLSILEWPAKNNPYAAGASGIPLTITTDMAPFVDVNSDGNYNPLDGDYPDIKGDQMLWWVFSDNGNTHSNANPPSSPLKVEIHAKAYAYKRNTLIDNVVYYEMDIANKSGSNYSGFRFGIWADADLGYYQDDYIGFDSVHRMGIVYNGMAVDGTGQPDAYGAQIPVAGVTFLRMPGDNVPLYQPAGSFMSYNNDFSVVGNPESDSNYNSYLRSTWKNGSHLKNDFKGPGIPSTGYSTGPDANYIFPGDPAIKSQWSECSSSNPPGDRRFIIATNDYTFAAGTSATVAFALVVTPPGNNGCPNTSFADIKTVADTAWQNFGNTFPTGIQNITGGENTPDIYPNPAHDRLFVNGVFTGIQVYDALGRKMVISPFTTSSRTEIPVSDLAPGIYHILLPGNSRTRSYTFVKE